ncbi:8455_t:CDS:2 [Ambispora leptoticha]|uniref:glucan 1,3-beta-glucosidase n=1 Tax=Ambispora leptoticha TaxID=144679 RepID=A0A9N8VT30_9GLOM|nr:8455_t:CDS:2 [Ambispora leptoticha]
MEKSYENSANSDTPTRGSKVNLVEQGVVGDKTAKKGFWGRHWWKFLFTLVLALAGGAVAAYFLWYKPAHDNSNAKSDHSLTGGSKNNDNNAPTPLPDPNNSTNTNGNDDYDDSNAPNSYTPPLNQPFAYGKQPIRGVNIGGWLVLEPFITPSYFNSGIVDEWTLCTNLGPEQANITLNNHYATFVTEDDFAQMAKVGLNHVRIPLGFWAIEVVSGEPYVPKLSWDYLLKGIGWARKYGLRVLVELHAAPGSQNGWNHSGKQGNIDWIVGPNGTANAERTLRIIQTMATFFNQPQYQHVTPMFGVLNEPRINYDSLTFSGVKQFYLDAYNIIRNITGTGQDFTPWLVYHDGFVGLNAWKGVMQGYERVALDTHSYLVFDKSGMLMPQPSLLAFPCAIWGNALAQSTVDFGLTITGEWTVSIDDCATYLNGVGNSAKYEGACSNCTCVGASDYKNWSADKKAFYLQFASAQIDAFESNGGGWFYWTWKTENHVNPTWDYQIGVQEGWIPNDLQNRAQTCKQLQQQYPGTFAQLKN